MRDIRVRFAIAVVLGLGTAPPLLAQDASRVGWTLGTGPHVSVATGHSSSGGLGAHAIVGAYLALTDRLVFHVEAMTMMQGGAGEDPSCTPSADACRARTFIPAQLHGGTISAAWSPLPQSKRLELIAGVGGYLGDGIGDSPWSGSLGLVAGAEVSMRANRRGPGLQLRYHHLARNIGDLRGVVVPSFTWRF